MRVPRLLVVGYLSIDTLHAGGACWDGVPGGAALYAALGARHAGARVTLAAAVGEDFPPAWLHALSGLGIDVSAVERRPGPTRRTRILHGPADARASPHHRDAAWHERTAALTPTLPPLAGFDAVVAAPVPAALLARLVRDAPCPVLADTSEAFAGPERDALMGAVPGLHAFAPSLAETRMLLPELDDDTAALALAARGPIVLQKRGPAGALLVRDGEAVPIPAPPARVVDPTGAGDATLGAFAAHLAAGQTAEAAARDALRTGALTVSAPGPAALGLVLDIPAERRCA